MTRDGDQPGHVVVVFGSSGTAGTGAIEACLAHPGVSEVRAVTRRPLGVSHAKLSEVICADFGDLTAISHSLAGVDSCLFCLGTSVRNVKGEDEYRTIHVAYALAAARMLLAQSPEASFIYVSGGGTNRTSAWMWARVKAEGEDRLAELGLSRHANVRPGGILPTNPKGASRWVLAPLLQVIPPLGIRAVDLGRAMLRLGLDTSWRGTRTLENKDLKALLREPARP